MPPHPFAEWSAEQLRLTVFLAPGAGNLAPEQWWGAIVGVPPDETATNQRLGSNTLLGAFHAGKLILKLEPGRIDWVFAATDPDPGGLAAGEFRSIGPITENLELFSTITERWLDRNDIPELVRIAFGAVVKHTEPDRRSAYLQLPNYLPLQINPDSSDFTFQINIPIGSRTEIEGLRINRLSRWAIMASAHVALRLEGTRVATASQQVMGHAIRLELDINTSPEFEGVLPRRQIAEVYRELVNFARDIITEGLHQ